MKADETGRIIAFGDRFDEIEAHAESRKLRLTIGLGFALTILAVLFGLLLCTSCASVAKGVPAVGAIATPEQAETALFLALSAYETAVTEINRAHAAGLIGEARYQELVSNQDSIARRVQHYGGLANAGIDAWKQTGDRTSFTSNYALAAAGLSQLEAAGGAK